MQDPLQPTWLQSSFNSDEPVHVRFTVFLHFNQAYMNLNLYDPANKTNERTKSPFRSGPVKIGKICGVNWLRTAAVDGQSIPRRRMRGSGVSELHRLTELRRRVQRDGVGQWQWMQQRNGLTGAEKQPLCPGRVASAAASLSPDGSLDGWLAIERRRCNSNSWLSAAELRETRPFVISLP